jgi:predicted ribonuclease toxin of YeeF-YezG toxin-antitoxin module
MNQVTEYSAVVAATQAAVSNDITTKGKWEKAGAIAAAFFGTESALTEIKAQYISDAILPALPARHTKALNAELPRKNSEEYKALTDVGRAAWEITNEAKKAARATCDTYFKRVVSYAFPKEKESSETATLKTKLAKMLADAIGKCEKAEAPDFDVSATLTGLRAALAAVSK